MKRIIKNTGFMVIEVLVASAIITISILAATAVAQKSIFVAHRAFHTTQAGFLLEEGAEEARIFRDNNTWANFTTIFNTSSTYYIPPNVSNWTSALPTTASGNLVDSIFTRTVTFANVNRNATTEDISGSGNNDSGTKLVTITVSWPEGGTTVSKTLQFYLMNIFS
jgi:Tfp pilus assembly protein PilV